MTSKATEIVKITTKAILDRRLLPGTKLGERELSGIFRASRVVIRQAMVELAEGGLVSIQRHKGAFVASPSLGEALEIYDALTIVEQAVAEILIERGGSSRLSELRQVNERQHKAIDESNRELAHDLGRDFHTGLVKLARNRQIEEFHAKLTRQASLLSSLYTTDPGVCGFAEDHDDIMDLIERGEVAAVKRKIQAHNNLVARSFHYDAVREQTLSLEEALNPYFSKDQKSA